MSKRIATISLDLDNQWSYMKIHGDEGWEEYPSYLNIFIPYVLDILDELQTKITFFIVGKDAVIEDNKPYLKMITERGHEVGNHSYNHESWLQKYNKEKIEEEITLAEQAIFNVTGQKPIGFRGPGFSWSKDLLNVLYNKGYQFDTSTLPTFIGPLARAYYFWKSDLSEKEKKDRKELYGSFKEGFRRLKPYFWDLEDAKKILEIPVTTIPVLKLPFHQSYLLYLHGISPFLMRIYLKLAFFMCRITGTPVCFLLHPLDLIGGDHAKELAFFPGMDIRSEIKTLVFKEVITQLKKRYHILTLNSYYKSINE